MQEEEGIKRRQRNICHVALETSIQMNDVVDRLEGVEIRRLLRCGPRLVAKGVVLVIV